MARILAALMCCLTMVGCTVSLSENQDDVYEQDDISIVDEESGGSENHGPSGAYNPCGSYDVLVLENPDGSVTVITLPIPCNPLDIDTGDPWPDSTSPVEQGQLVQPNN